MSAGGERVRVVGTVGLQHGGQQFGVLGRGRVARLAVPSGELGPRGQGRAAAIGMLNSSAECVHPCVPPPRASPDASPAKSRLIFEQRLTLTLPKVGVCLYL